MPTSLFEIACDDQPFDVVPAHLFKPNTLVDAALSAVKNSRGLLGLFPTDDALAVTGIVDLHDQFIVLLHRFGDVKVEGEVSPAMTADANAIEMDSAAVVYGLEM